MTMQVNTCISPVINGSLGMNNECFTGSKKNFRIKKSAWLGKVTLKYLPLQSDIGWRCNEWTLQRGLCAQASDLKVEPRCSHPLNGGRPLDPLISS